MWVHDREYYRLSQKIFFLKDTLGAVIFSLGNHLLPPTLAPHWKQLKKKKLALRNKRYVDTGQ